VLIKYRRGVGKKVCVRFVSLVFLVFSEEGLLLEELDLDRDRGAAVGAVAESFKLSKLTSPNMSPTSLAIKPAWYLASSSRVQSTIIS
jgi:hypothetical protein